MVNTPSRNAFVVGLALPELLLMALIPNKVVDASVMFCNLILWSPTGVVSDVHP